MTRPTRQEMDDAIRRLVAAAEHAHRVGIHPRNCPRRAPGGDCNCWILGLAVALGLPGLDPYREAEAPAPRPTPAQLAALRRISAGQFGEASVLPEDADECLALCVAGLAVCGDFLDVGTGYAITAAGRQVLADAEKETP